MKTSSVLSSAVRSPRLLPIRRFPLFLLPLFFSVFSGGNLLYAQERLQLSFQHEARGSAELQRADSGLIVSNLGNGPEDRVVLVLGRVPTDREPFSQFIVQLRERTASFPVGSSFLYEFLGSEVGGTPEVQSSLRVTKIDSGTVFYSLNFRDATEISTSFSDGHTADLDTGSLTFSVPVNYTDTLREQVECGCFQQAFTKQPVCVWEIGWNSPLEIRVFGVDTVYRLRSLRFTAIRSVQLPAYMIALELSADSIPTITINGEGVRRFGWQEHNVYSAAGNVQLRIASDNRIAATGFENGIRDGIDVWSTSGAGEAVGVDIEANLGNPEACIYTTFHNNSDTLGYVGLVRDDIGIRLLAQLQYLASDSSLLRTKVGTSEFFLVPQNQVLGRIRQTALLSRLEYSSTHPWFQQGYRMEFSQPITLENEAGIYTGSSVLINHAKSQVYDERIFENVRIRAGDIDTILIGEIAQYWVSVEDPPQQEGHEPTLQLVRRADALYLWYNGIEPGRGWLRIIDMAGRVVREVPDLQLPQKEGVLPLDIVPLPAGAYLLELDAGGGRVAGKSVLTGI